MYASEISAAALMTLNTNTTRGASRAAVGRNDLFWLPDAPRPRGQGRWLIKLICQVQTLAEAVGAAAAELTPSSHKAATRAGIRE
jgi:hypothetical protein